MFFLSLSGMEPAATLGGRLHPAKSEATPLWAGSEATFSFAEFQSFHAPISHMPRQLFVLQYFMAITVLFYCVIPLCSPSLVPSSCSLHVCHSY